MTWREARLQRASRHLGRRAATWSAILLFTLFGLSKAVHGGSAPGYHSVEVGRGDTLWTIAAVNYPDADTRAKVDEIMKANRLAEPLVYPGEELRIPNE